jgi:hypothetical protein
LINHNKKKTSFLMCVHHIFLGCVANSTYDETGSHVKKGQVMSKYINRKEIMKIHYMV